MNSVMKQVGFWLIIAAIVAATPGCRKIQEDTLIKGLWRLKSVQFDTISQNQMVNLFPNYIPASSCCIYKLDFQEDDVVFGYYLLNDTFDYVQIGTWRLDDYKHMELKIDRFADGTFEIIKQEVKKYKLESPDNHIKYFEAIDPAKDTAETVIIIERI